MLHPVQYHSCFISYAHQDGNPARRLHADLQDHGVRCWFAPHNMKIRARIRRSLSLKRRKTSLFIKIETFIFILALHFKQASGFTKQAEDPGLLSLNRRALQQNISSAWDERRRCLQYPQRMDGLCSINI